MSLPVEHARVIISSKMCCPHKQYQELIIDHAQGTWSMINILRQQLVVVSHIVVLKFMNRYLMYKSRDVCYSVPVSIGAALGVGSNGRATCFFRIKSFSRSIK